MFWKAFIAVRNGRFSAAKKMYSKFSALQALSVQNKITVLIS